MWPLAFLVLFPHFKLSIIISTFNQFRLLITELNYTPDYWMTFSIIQYVIRRKPLYRFTVFLTVCGGIKVFNDRCCLFYCHIAIMIVVKRPAGRNAFILYDTSTNPRLLICGQVPIQYKDNMQHVK